MEIRSARGSLPGLESLGNETHLRVALAEAKRLSDHCVLYSLVAFHLNPAPGEPLKSRADAPPFSASCMTAHGYTVLQIAYLDGFVDTFRFDGRHVEKSGTFSVKQRLSQWTECLEASDTARVAAR
jgi:hypothetical protein